MENLKLWNEWENPPKEALKDFNNGSFKGTDINTMWRIKILTEKFGMCGIGWYYDIIKIWNDQIAEEVVTNAEIKLFVKVDNEWSKGISGVGGNKMRKYNTQKKYYQTNDEAIKMAVTDALGNACRNLGMGARVYWENDKTKYTDAEECNNKPAPTQQVITGGDYIIKDGQYKGQTLNEILSHDEAYLRQLLQHPKTSIFIKKNIEMALTDAGLMPNEVII